MNLFRSEEHLTRWLHYFQAVDEYVLPVSDWAEIFGSSIFRRRLEPDYLARAPEYLEDYRRALRATGKRLTVNRFLAAANTGFRHEVPGTVGPTTWLQGKHTIFGKVTDAASQAVVEKIKGQTQSRRGTFNDDPLWNDAWVLLLFTGLIAVEWMMRKTARLL